jgi:hypothetical protein
MSVKQPRPGQGCFLCLLRLGSFGIECCLLLNRTYREIASILDRARGWIARYWIFPFVESIHEIANATLPTTSLLIPDSASALAVPGHAWSLTSM